MTPEARRQHLHDSVAAAALYGLVCGAWLGARAMSAGAFEWCAFVAFLLFAPGVVASRIDRRHRYTD